MPSADRLEEFVVIVDAGSISAAARVLELPRATLSRRISGLEQELGVRLFHRQTRRLDLTHAGTLLLERARCVVEDAAAAWRAVETLDETPRGRLRVSLPPTELFHALLLGFCRAYPEVVLEVAATPRNVDLLENKVDVAIRFGGATPPDMIVRQLGRDRIVAVASPRYLEAHHPIRTPDDLAEHSCLLAFEGDWKPATRWPLLSGDAVTVGGTLVSDEGPLRLRAALAGLGITLLPEPLCAPYVESGQLRQVLPTQLGAQTTAILVFPEREFIPKQVRAFIDYTVENLRESLMLSRDGLPAVEPSVRTK